MGSKIVNLFEFMVSISIGGHIQAKQPFLGQVAIMGTLNLPQIKNQCKYAMWGIHLKDLTALIYITYVWALKWLLVAIMAFFGQVTTLYGHLTDHNYKNPHNYVTWGNNPDNLTTQIDIKYLQASKWSMLVMMTIFWPSGHFHGHLTDCKYKNFIEGHQ